MLLYVDFFMYRYMIVDMIKFRKLVVIFKISTSFYVLFLQNTVIYLHRTHCIICLLISPKSNGNIIVCNYHDNILAFKMDKYEILLDFDVIYYFFYLIFFIYCS